MPSCWIEIKKSALRHNFRAVQSLVGAQVRVIAVVKANAYGCGGASCAQAFAEAGAEYFAVTRAEEAIPLREAGLATPILLAPAPEDDLKAIFEYDLTACAGDLQDAQRLSNLASRLRKQAKIHLKVDTGMGRFGVAPDEALQVARQIRDLPQVQLKGVFTHFANATHSDCTATQNQFNQFEPLAQQIAAPMSHCANSAALIRFPEMRLNAVRPGTILYGQFPSASATTPALELQDPFTAKARIITIRRVKKGENIGYGSEWTASKESVIGILACGYADGLALEPKTRTETPLSMIGTAMGRAARQIIFSQKSRTPTLRGQKAAIVGRIAMQTCAIDLTDIVGAQAGEEVTVPMRRTAAGGHLRRIYLD